MGPAVLWAVKPDVYKLKGSYVHTAYSLLDARLGDGRVPRAPHRAMTGLPVQSASSLLVLLL